MACRSHHTRRGHAARGTTPSAVGLTALAVLMLGGCANSLDTDAGNAVFVTLPQADGDKPTGAISAAPGPATSVPTTAAIPVKAGGSPPVTAAAQPGPGAYRIGALDVLEMAVFKAPDLSRTMQVADSGTANFPLIGEIQVVGRTVQEVERDLAKQLGVKYLQNPQVTLAVKEFNSQRVTVEGAVRKPGVFPLRGPATLLQFIATAEGFDATASSDLTLHRLQPDGKRTTLHFDMTDIRNGTSPDPALHSGDVIVVSASFAKQTFENFVKVLPVAGAVAPKL